jgi:hypothetical protein
VIQLKKEFSVPIHRQAARDNVQDLRIRFEAASSFISARYQVDKEGKHR